MAWDRCGRSSVRFGEFEWFSICVIVVWRLRSQAEYHSVFEDWLFHVLLPFAAYVALIVSALIASSHLGEALFAIGAAALLLLFDGIHNAWDGVAYHLFTKRQ
jgi:hypothetical protein